MAEGTGEARDRVPLARVNLTLPDALLRRIREEAPELNLSGLFREAIGGRLECGHDRLVCLDCSTPVLAETVARRRVRGLWLSVKEALELAYLEGRSLGSAVRAARASAAEHGAANEREPLPRRTRAEREERRYGVDEDEDGLPTLGYLELVGNLAVPETLPGWRKLGEELAGRPDWRFEVNEDALPMWVCEAPDLTASVGLDRRRRTEFELLWHSGDDVAHSWALRSPAELVELAVSVRVGEDLPEAVMLGPWIEQEFLARLAGVEAAG